MFSELIFFILGFILGGIVVVLRTAMREQDFMAEIEGLARRNEKLMNRLTREKMPAENPEAAHEQGKDPGDDAIGVEKDPFEGIEK